MKTTLVLLYLLISVGLFSCNNSVKKKNIPPLENFPKINLTAKDSLLIDSIVRLIVRFDTIKTDPKFNCKKEIAGMDNTGNKLYTEYKTNCSADIRAQFGSKFFINSKHDTVLMYSYDGMGKPLEIVRK